MIFNHQDTKGTKKDILMRKYRDVDAKDFADIHYDSVHNVSAEYYSADIIHQWSPPVTQERINQIQDSAKTEERIMVDYNGVCAGLGAIALDENELRACYVHSDFMRLGIGLTIVTELENFAKSHGLKYLTLDSSFNAKDFYVSCGYDVIKKDSHQLRSGLKMDCFKMKKNLVSSRLGGSKNDGVGKI